MKIKATWGGSNERYQQSHEIEFNSDGGCLAVIVNQMARLLVAVGHSREKVAAEFQKHGHRISNAEETTANAAPSATE